MNIFLPYPDSIGTSVNSLDDRRLIKQECVKMTNLIYKETAEKYLKSKRTKATERNYRNIISGFGEYLERTAQGTTPAAVEQWKAELFETVKPNTIAHYMTVLDKFFNYCVVVGVLEQNPISALEKPKLEQIHFDNLLTKEEITLLLNLAPEGMHEKTTCRNRAIVVLFLQTGIRNSELRALTLADLNFEQNYITVRHGKGDKRRQVPFPALSREAVKAYLKSGVRPNRIGDDGLLFGTDADENGHTTNGRLWKEISSAGLNTMIKRYVRLVTGKEIHAHLLRHAAASLWDDMGVPLRTIQSALGHSSMRTTETVYVNILNRKKAANDINLAFDGI